MGGWYKCPQCGETLHGPGNYCPPCYRCGWKRPPEKKVIETPPAPHDQVLDWLADKPWRPYLIGLGLVGLALAALAGLFALARAAIVVLSRWLA